MHLHAFSLWVTASILVLGCADAPLTKPVQVMILAVSADGAVAPRQVELTTVENLVQLRGLAAQFVGGTRFDIREYPIGQDPNENLRLLSSDVGAAPKGQFTLKDGVNWPLDFHTWGMTTAYYGFERTLQHFTRHADPNADPVLERTRVLYWLHEETGTPTPVVDQAAYMPMIDSFLLYPTSRTSGFSLAMNPGVIAHEAAHKVFGYRVLEKRQTPAGKTAWLLYALQEGLADFHGFSVTCETVSGCLPGFLSLSVKASAPNGALAQFRDPSNSKACMTPTLRAALSAPLTAETIYTHGAVWAAALYRAATTVSAPAGRLEAINKGVIRAYNNDGAAAPDLHRLVLEGLASPPSFTSEKVANAIVANMAEDEALRADVCSALASRLDLSCTTFPCAAMPACPASSVRVACE
jgi:hypothetical protein